MSKVFVQDFCSPRRSERFIAKSHPAMLNLTLAVSMLGVLVWVMLPRVAPVLLPLAVAVPSAWNLVRYRGVPSASGSWMYAVLAAFALYLLANAFWAEHFNSAFRTATIMSLYFVCVFVGVEALKQAEPRVLRVLGIGVCVGTVLAAVYLFVDVVGSRSIWKAAMTAVAKFNTPGAPSDIGPYGTSQQYVYPYVLNVAFAVFSCLLFPILLVGSAFIAPIWQRTYVALVLSIGCALVFLSEHESSQVAVVAGIFVFFLFQIASKFTSALMILGWITATLFVVPITQAAHDINLHHSSLMHPSARARIVIWKQTGNGVGEAPILGIGIGSTRSRDRSTQEKENVPGSHVALGTSIHAHSFFMQAWYELGAIGAGFLLAIGLLIIRQMRQQPDELQPYLFASFAVPSVLAGLSWSLFALWWVATIILASLVAWLGVRVFYLFPKKVWHSLPAAATNSQSRPVRLQQ